jgi:hypothetical protein
MNSRLYKNNNHAKLKKLFNKITNDIVKKKGRFTMKNEFKIMPPVIKKLVYCATPSRLSSKTTEIMDYVTGGLWTISSIPSF